MDKYYWKNEYFKILLKKHNLINSNKKLDIDSNRLFFLLYYLHKTPAQVTFYKNQLFASISVRHLILLVQGKYKSLKVLYLLGLLKRQKVPFNTRTHTISAFLIPDYTEELFSSTILPRAKQLMDMNLSKITYTIVARNFGLETADFVFKNEKLKSKAIADFITIDDILTILATSNTLKDKITRYGFITVNDIRYELQLLNEERKENGLPFREIVDSDITFVSSMVRNITEIKDLLNELGLKYTKLGRPTIEKIKKYQKKNEIEDVTLTLNQTKIVRKDLIVRKKKK